MSTSTVDVVVAGAGHNALVTAAYLAASGREVLVVDSRDIPGGGAASEELLSPGYVLDSCSTGHTLIQTNPLLTADELGLLGRHGLEYLIPDPFAHVAFPDGRHLTTWMDLDRTCEEIAAYSKADADAYRRLLAEYDEVKHLFGAASFTPVGFGPSLEERLREHPKGNIWLRRRALSAWDLISREFESKHIQAFLLWQAYQTLVPVDAPGSGPLAHSVVFGRQQRSWTLPRGGSGKLTDALVAAIEEHGGTVLCGRRVTRLVLEKGRCAGVECETGETFMARDAVVSTIHVKHLVDMAPREVWGEDFEYGVETFDVGVPCSATFLATTAAPQFDTPEGPRTAVSAGLAGFPEDVIQYMRDLRDGKWVDVPQWVLVATPTLTDPSRAPAGHHTVKFLVPNSYGFPERKEAMADATLRRVQEVCSNFTDDVVLERLVRGPEDIEANNEHMIRGTFHGGDRTMPQSGALRPVPGWAQHRMPIPGLYQTGGTTHPGGSITGGPGRNAAVVLLKDLGTSIEEVVSDAGRPRAGRH
jgi:phytoene dehydrogenase-like protein